MLNSLSLFVGTGKCNANCAHCAGKIHRNFAPKIDGEISRELFYKTLKEGYQNGARSLSISSSGEPTLSPLAVSKTLEMVYDLKKEAINYEWINLYSNGIRIGEDKKFCEDYLSTWRALGLKTIYVTVHDLDERKNALIYGVKSYPSIDLVVSRIHDAGLLTRANLVLNKNNVPTFEKFFNTVNRLREIGFDHISAWPIRGENDKVDLDLSPSREELDKMSHWAEKNSNESHRIRLLLEDHHEVYERGEKLTLFPDGKLSNSWCN